MTPNDIIARMREQHETDFRQPEFWTDRTPETIVKIIYDHKPGVETLLGFTIQKPIPLPEHNTIAYIKLETDTGLIVIQVSNTTRYSILNPSDCMKVRDKYIYNQIEEIE